MATIAVNEPATFHTTEAYVSGAICGHMWWPDAMAGKPFRKSLRGSWGIMGRVSGLGVTFADALQFLLMEDGGDFQDAQFSADTRITVIRRKITGPGKYELHVWERELADLPTCADLVNADAYTGDFFNDNN
jgi:hypothetical protein